MRTAIILGLALVCLLLVYQGFKYLWRAVFPHLDGEPAPDSFLTSLWGRLLLFLLLAAFLVLGYQELQNEPENPAHLRYRPAVWKDGQLVPGGFEPAPPAKTP